MIYTHTPIHTFTHRHTRANAHTVCYQIKNNTHLDIFISLSNNKSSKYKESLSSLVFSNTHTYTHNQKKSLVSSHIAQFVLKQALGGGRIFKTCQHE